jgi:beta-lactamase regulating signal transducer with metallopeptidase domain
MSAALMFALGLLAKATVLLLAGSLLALALRKRSASLRHALWSLVMIGLLALPALCAWLPPMLVPMGEWARTLSAPAPTPMPVRTATTIAETTSGAPTYSAAAARFWLPTRVEAGTDAASVPKPIDWLRLAAIAYLFGALFLLGRLALAHAAASRLVRRASDVQDSDWLAPLMEASRRLGLRRPVRLLRSADAPVPFAIGAGTPAVVLPLAADGWCPARRKAVLSHELAHVLRRDCLTQALASVVCALYWPHPLAWWAASRLRLERELACDDRALALGQAPTDYAGHLLELARAFRPHRSLTGAALAMAAPSQLEQRLLHLLDGKRERGTPGRVARVVVATAFAVALLPLAAMRAAPPAKPAAPAISTASKIAPAPEEANEDPVTTGTWSLRRSDETSGDPDSMVHLGLTASGVSTFDIARDELEGFDAGWLRGEHDVRFALHREPGTLRFEGHFRDGVGTGHFEYRANPDFAVELQRRGMRAPTAAEQFTLTRRGASLAYLDALDRYGYAKPSTESFVRALSKVSLDYLEEVSQAGLRGSTLDDLVTVAKRGLEPEDVTRYVEEGRAIDATQLLQELRKPDKADRPDKPDKAMDEQDVQGDPGDFDAVNEPVTVAAYASNGSTPTTGHWRIYDQHGRVAQMELAWDDGTQWRRELRLEELNGDDEKHFRIDGEAGTFEFHGKLSKGRGTFEFIPNRDFPAKLRAIGIRGTEESSDHLLKNLAYGGASVESVQELRKLGVRNLDFKGLVDLAVFDVRPDFVREMRAENQLNTNTVAGITDLRLRH